MRHIDSMCAFRTGAPRRLAALRTTLAVAASTLLLQAGLARASDASVVQDGLTSKVSIDQFASAGSVRVMQHGGNNRSDISQLGVAGSGVAITQGGTHNLLQVGQTQGGADFIEVTQGGAGNQASLAQTGVTGAPTHNLIAARQLGTGGAIDVQQNAAGATAAVYQSALSSGDRATLYQAAIAPIGAIEQGVLRENRPPFEIQAEAQRVRNGGPFTAAPSAQSAATLTQTGGEGLLALVVQSGGGQSASISQNGSYLEAEILQSGGAHAATIVQAGSGTAASPYRASIIQMGAQPQSFSIQQTAGAAPRVIRVIQQ